MSISDDDLRRGRKPAPRKIPPKERVRKARALRRWERRQANPALRKLGLERKARREARNFSVGYEALVRGIFEAIERGEIAARESAARWAWYRECADRELGVYGASLPDDLSGWPIRENESIREFWRRVWRETPPIHFPGVRRRVNAMARILG